MLYVIIGFDGPQGKDKHPIHRPAHLERLETLDKQGKLILAGPLTDGTGSLIVMEALTLSEAEQFAQEDPYFIHGIFETISVHPFTQVLPSPI